MKFAWHLRNAIKPELINALKASEPSGRNPIVDKERCPNIAFLNISYIAP